MRPRTLVLFIAIIVCGAAAGEWYVSLAEGPDEVTCDAATRPLARLPDVPEASGLSVGRRDPAVLWTFNDSDDPTLYALDGRGQVTGRVRLRGVPTRNWEDISSGACGNGSCLYVADIGDNDGDRDQIAVYRIPEPHAGDAESASFETFTAKYPDRPHDAEALFVAPDEGLFIVTKDTPATVYRFPQPLQPGRVMTLQEVALLPMENVTDAEASPDGRWIGIRTKEEMLFFRAPQLTSGGTEHGSPISLRALHEPQGEGIAIARDGTVYLAGEGGGHGAAGTFTSLRCRFP
jgi:hypothetical protein